MHFCISVRKPYGPDTTALYSRVPSLHLQHRFQLYLEEWFIKPREPKVLISQNVPSPPTCRCKWIYWSNAPLFMSSIPAFDFPFLPS